MHLRLYKVVIKDKCVSSCTSNTDQVEETGSLTGGSSLKLQILIPHESIESLGKSSLFDNAYVTTLRDILKEIAIKDKLTFCHDHTAEKVCRI